MRYTFRVFLALGAALCGFSTASFGAMPNPSVPVSVPANSSTAQHFASAEEAAAYYNPAFSAALTAQDIAAMDTATRSILDSPTLTPHERFNVLWKAYLENRSHAIGSRYLLEVLAHTSDRNGMQRLIDEFNSSTVPLANQARIINATVTLYHQVRRSMTEQRRELPEAKAIRKFLVDATKSADANIAGTATVALSRFETDPSSISASSSAYDRGAINAEAYGRELLMRLPTLDPQQQVQAVDRLSRAALHSPNNAIVENIATMIAALYGPRVIDSFGPEVRQKLDTILSAGEPAILVSGDRISTISAVKYAHWITSKARFAGVDEAALPDFLMKEMLSEQSSEARILAIMMSPYGGRVLQKAGADDKKRLIDKLAKAEDATAPSRSSIRLQTIDALSGPVLATDGKGRPFPPHTQP